MPRPGFIMIALLLLSSSQLNAQAPRVSSESLEAIGGLATNVLIANNLNVGLTLELRKADAADAQLVLTIMTQIESQTSVNIQQLQAFARKTRLTREDTEYLNLVLDGLKGVNAQAAAVKEAFEKGENSLLEKYTKSRKETEAIIKKIVEE